MTIAVDFDGVLHTYDALADARHLKVRAEYLAARRPSVACGVYPPRVTGHFPQEMHSQHSGKWPKNDTWCNDPGISLGRYS